MTKDFYDLLGVDEDASKEEIRDAFREMVQEYHPDRNDDPRATAQFTAIKKAYDTLKSSSERQSYDRLGHSTYVAKRMDGMPDPGSWPSEDEDEDDADASSSSATSSTAGSGTTGSSSKTTSNSTTSRSSRTTSTSSGTAESDAGTSRSGSSSSGPGSSGSGRASTRSSAGSTSRSSSGSTSNSSTSSRTSSASRSGSGSAGGSSSSSRSSRSGSSRSTTSGSSGASTSNAGSTDASGAGSTVGDGGTAQAGAADAAANAAAGGTASGGTTSGGSSASSDTAGGVTGLLFDNAVANWFKTASLGWPLIFLSIALYVAGVGYYGYANRAGLTTLGGELGAAGADVAALRGALVGDRYGVTTGWEYASGVVAGDAVGAAAGLFVAGAMLMPVVFLVVIRKTRQYYGWDPSYLYALGVATPAVGLLANVAIATGAAGSVATMPLAAELVCYGVLPGLAIATLLARGFVWPRVKAIGS